MTILERFKLVTTFVFDVDGVLTDGTLLVLKDGHMARRMNIKDGYALQLAVKKGYRVLVLSGSTSTAVHDRLNRLGVRDVFFDVTNKRQKLAVYQAEHGLKKEELLFMGDDMPDYAVMQEVGLPCCPADAVPEIIGSSIYVSHANGGMGCVRDVIEKVLKLNGHWDLDSGIAAK
jgi:3-deoxy-D-manno-octulosonate 8-phosphate phosphatase (KDO 8-P phosphatase)